MMKRPIWIDTDTGVDDAFAILCALQLDEVEVMGISAVAGNVGHDRTFINARNVLSLAKREDIKVYPGAIRPMCIELKDASHVHGNDGLGGVTLSSSPAVMETCYAWDALYAEAVKQKGELEVVAVGPLTNIAQSIFKYPELKKLIKRIIIMGGAAVGGNATSAAEFNIYADPHAAQAVFMSEIPVVMFGLDVTLKSYLKVEDVKRIGNHGTKVCRFFEEAAQSNIATYTKFYRPMLCIHDAAPILYLQYPELFTGQEAGVFVETQSEICFGKTVTDLWSDTKFQKRNTIVMLDVDREAFVEKIESLLTRYTD